MLFPSHVITIQQKKHRSVFRCHCYNCCTTKVIQENVFLNVKASSVAASNNSVHSVYLVYSDYYISTSCRRCQQNFQQFSKNLRFFAILRQFCHFAYKKQGDAVGHPQICYFLNLLNNPLTLSRPAFATSLTLSATSSKVGLSVAVSLCCLSWVAGCGAGC